MDERNTAEQTTKDYSFNKQGGEPLELRFVTA